MFARPAPSSFPGSAMKRLFALLLAALALTALGCGGDRDRNVNSGKDLPRTPTNKAE